MHARKLLAQELGDPSFDRVAWRGPRHEPTKDTMTMHERGKSDRPIVPRKPPNKGGAAASLAEGAEGRGLAKENPFQQTQPIGHSAAPGWQNALERIRQAASRDRTVRFTALWHHVAHVERLREAYFALRRDSVPGVDGQTWQQYGEDLDANLEDLSSRLHRGAYHAKPVQRAYIPKPDGRQRPIGIPTLEDKIAQRSAVQVLSAVYETDFLDFSYGFRPGRSQHDALDALTVGLTRQKVSWVLDADIRGFFDTLDHGWLVKFVEHRIADRRVVRHVKKWLNAGVLEDGRRMQVEEGTPQGGSISPLLANIYLHYVFDLWADLWSRKQARGDMLVVRYADDFVVGFQHRDDAERFVAELGERFAGFGLALHPDKTRLLEFGRFAAERRAHRGQGRPETFDFLGFTHQCSQDATGRFRVRRQTMCQRVHGKLKQVYQQLRRRMHDPIREVAQWLRSVVTGHNRYYGVPGNREALKSFRYHLVDLWRRVLQRRSQKHRLRWARMVDLARQWLPYATIHHPEPWERLRV
jgi:RNA-directed DNA polymerase